MRTPFLYLKDVGGLLEICAILTDPAMARFGSYTCSRLNRRDVTLTTREDVA